MTPCCALAQRTSPAAVSLSVKIDQSLTESTTEEVIFLTANHCPLFVFTIMQWLQIKLLDDVCRLSTKMQQDQENTIASCGQAVHCVYFCRTVGALHPVLRLSDGLKLLLRCTFPFNVLNLLFSILFFSNPVWVSSSLQSVREAVWSWCYRVPSAVDFLRGWMVYDGVSVCMCTYVRVGKR